MFFYKPRHTPTDIQSRSSSLQIRLPLLLSPWFKLLQFFVFTFTAHHCLFLWGAATQTLWLNYILFYSNLRLQRKWNRIVWNMYYKLYSWLRIKSLPTRTTSLTRLWIEKEGSFRQIWISFGMVFRNERWGNFETWNLTTHLFSQNFVWGRFVWKLLLSAILILLGIFYYHISGTTNMVVFFLFSIVDFVHYITLLLVWYGYLFMGQLRKHAHQLVRFQLLTFPTREKRAASFLTSGRASPDTGGDNLKSASWLPFFHSLYAYTLTLNSLQTAYALQDVTTAAPEGGALFPKPHAQLEFWITTNPTNASLSTEAYWRELTWLQKYAQFANQIPHFTTFIRHWKYYMSLSTLQIPGNEGKLNWWRGETLNARAINENLEPALIHNESALQFFLFRIAWTGEQNRRVTTLPNSYPIVTRMNKPSLIPPCTNLYSLPPQISWHLLQNLKHPPVVVNFHPLITDIIFDEI